MRSRDPSGVAIFLGSPRRLRSSWYIPIWRACPDLSGAMTTKKLLSLGINMEKENKKNNHDKYAPYWAVALFVFGALSLSTIWIDLGKFWKGYVLDMTGPAWNYILFRGLYTAYADNFWTRFFTPNRTLVIFLIVCFGIETLQYFKIYDSTFDLLDLLAYVSILMPVFLLDKKQQERMSLE